MPTPSLLPSVGELMAEMMPSDFVPSTGSTGGRGGGFLGELLGELMGEMLPSDLLPNFEGMPNLGEMMGELMEIGRAHV